MSNAEQLLPKVGFRDIDAAVVKQFGPDLELVQVPADRGEIRGTFQRDQYCVNVPRVKGPDVYGGKVPIVMVPTQTAFIPYLLPCFAIRPGSPQPALDRWHAGEQIREPAHGARELSVVNSLGQTVTGFSHYVQREGPLTWDIDYDIQLYTHAHRNTLMRMLAFLFTKFYPRGGMVTVTKEGRVYTYEMLVNQPVNISELVSVSETTHAYSVNISILASIDHVDDEEDLDVVPAFTGGVPTLNLHPIDD